MPGPPPGTPLERLLARQARASFREGLAGPFRALGWLVRRPRLWALCIAPVLLNLFVLCPIVFLLLRWLVFNPLAAHLPKTEGFWSMLASTSGEVLLLVLNIATTGPFFFLFAIILTAIFSDRVGEDIERERLAERPHLLAPQASLVAGVSHSVFESLRRLGIVLPLLIVSPLLGLIPVVGPALVFIVQTLLGAGFFALDAFGMPMDRRSVRLPEKLRFLRANKAYALGFGAPFLVVPCAFMLVPPLAAIAGSLEFCDLILEEDSHPG